MTREYLDHIIEETNHNDPYNETNGLTAVRLEEGFSVVEMTLLPEHRNIWGTPHGGILFGIADLAAGIAADSVREGMHIVTACSSINFLAAPDPQALKLRAEGRVIKAGRHINVVQADVYDDRESHLVTGQFNMFNTK